MTDVDASVVLVMSVVAGILPAERNLPIMSVFTSPIPTASSHGPRYRSRKAERRMLARRLRLRDRRRRYDLFTYRFRHVIEVLAGGFLATVAVVVAKSAGWI